ncbi:hypothetical protein [Actinomadura rayongensis]|uniref:DUF4760 domain-containing protein n=1 Tax=Actinomadura rayongensis TaxID=1429076 RepID=A0A6I4WA38_9ACTN|nr:hypothetical protein [Actinomadura rayongensis]MXQ67709.1 hypothetical protein [Actinomadura rayongensis]
MSAIGIALIGVGGTAVGAISASLGGIGQKAYEFRAEARRERNAEQRREQKDSATELLTVLGELRELPERPRDGENAKQWDELRGSLMLRVAELCEALREPRLVMRSKPFHALARFGFMKALDRMLNEELARFILVRDLERAIKKFLGGLPIPKLDSDAQWVHDMVDSYDKFLRDLLKSGIRGYGRSRIWREARWRRRRRMRKNFRAESK